MFAQLVLSVSVLAQLPTPLERQHHASASPTGDTLVIHQHFLVDEGGDQPVRRTWLMTTDTEQTLTEPLFQPDGENAQEPRWSPNGEWIAFVGGPGYGVGEHALQIIRPDGSEHRVLARDDTGLIKSPSWSADGRRIAFEVRNPEAGWAHVDILDLETGDRRRVTQDIAGLNQHPRMAPEGRHLLVSWRDPETAEGDLYLHDLAGEQAPRQITHSPWVENMPTWHPTGQYVVYSRAMEAGNHDLFAVDVETGDLLQITDTPGVMEFFPAFTRDGQTLFYDHFEMTETGPRSQVQQRAWPGDVIPGSGPSDR